MIKKFSQYIKENQLTLEEFEDQFLRLEEVFNIGYDLQVPNYLVKNFIKDSKNGIEARTRFTVYPYNWREIYNIEGSYYRPHYSVEAREELNNIKRRLETMYPITFTWEQEDPHYFILIKMATN
jgi:hypothetical protein